MPIGKDTLSNLDTVTEVPTEEVEIHNVDTEVKVYDKLSDEWDCGDEADVENPLDENLTFQLISRGPVIHVLYSYEKQAEMVFFQPKSLCSLGLIP